MMNLRPEDQRCSKSPGERQRHARYWLRCAGVTNPSPELVAAVAEHAGSCPSGSWKSMAVECLARKGVMPTPETINDKLAAWTACLTEYARRAGEAEPEQWAAKVMQMGRGRGQRVIKLPRPAVAMAWLDILGQPVTLLQIDRLAPWVQRIGHVTRREVLGWQALVSRGELPTPEAVEREVLAQRSQVPDDLAGRTSEVVAFVTNFVARRDVGPTWQEVGATFGWSRPEVDAAIHHLGEHGLLSFTETKRSLRPGPRGIATASKPSTASRC
ncbi:hypothetical protein [Nonomuraea insulae]|uniref:Uncharacterized protein n=1 Tax=Nonomuraea insulae TaxID=1616787 RepID=A0ABW1CSS8_9ACTN